MNCVISYLERKSLIHWRTACGVPLDDITPDLAAVESGHFEGGKTRRIVTWEELMRRRRERQEEELERKRWGTAPELRAVRVMTWLNHCFPFEGWHCRVDTLSSQEDCSLRGGPVNLMEEFPLDVKSFDEWMVAFAKAFRDKRKLKHRQGRRQYPRGVVFCWATFSRGRLKAVHRNHP